MSRTQLLIRKRVRAPTDALHIERRLPGLQYTGCKQKRQRALINILLGTEGYTGETVRIMVAYTGCEQRRVCAPMNNLLYI